MSVVTILPECKTQNKSTDTPTSIKSSRTSTKSIDSMFSSGSSKFSVLHRRKMGNRGYRDRGPMLIPAVSEVQQRVKSAKILRVKNLQNQIAEAHLRINELTIENRLLQQMHKRQDSALSKYESTNAELPKLLHSHAEEVRMWQTRARNMQRQNKELMSKLKQSDGVNLMLTDQNRHLTLLSKEKNLEEREKLQEKVRDLESRLIEKDNDLKLLARRLQLEMKAHRSNVQVEQAKYREFLSKIEFAEFLHDEKRSQKSSQLLRFKSPNRHPQLTSKSATSLHAANFSNHDKNALILPPCEGQEAIVVGKKEIETSPKTKTSKMQISSNLVNNEMSLTKNNREKLTMKNGSTITNKTSNDDVEIKITLLNGNEANHARPKKLIHSQKPKIFSKIQPLQLTNNKEKETSMKNGNHSDDSSTVKENGNMKDLLDHKLNINDLESKLKNGKFQCDETSSSSSSFSFTSPDICSRSKRVFDKLPGHSMEKNDDQELTNFRREIRDGHDKRESLLDELCDAIVESKPIQRIAPHHHNGNHEKLQAKIANHHDKINGKFGLDPKKKSNLLAQLKNIDDES